VTKPTTGPLYRRVIRRLIPTACPPPMTTHRRPRPSDTTAHRVQQFVRPLTTVHPPAYCPRPLHPSRATTWPTSTITRHSALDACRTAAPCPCCPTAVVCRMQTVNHMRRASSSRRRRLSNMTASGWRVAHCSILLPRMRNSTCTMVRSAQH
jgi:hypothetical protein